MPRVSGTRGENVKNAEICENNTKITSKSQKNPANPKKTPPDLVDVVGTVDRGGWLVGGGGGWGPLRGGPEIQLIEMHSLQEKLFSLQTHFLLQTSFFCEILFCKRNSFLENPENSGKSGKLPPNLVDVVGAVDRGGWLVGGGGLGAAARRPKEIKRI